MERLALRGFVELPGEALVGEAALVGAEDAEGEELAAGPQRLLGRQTDRRTDGQ